MYKNVIELFNVRKTLVTINHEQETQQGQTKSVDSIHHIHILDRSGSMSRDIKDLIENVKQTIDVMHENDYVSIVWFSGHDQCKSLLKGGKKDKSLHKLLDSIASTVGLTCFSTPMKEVNEIINEWKAVTPNFSITLFTDGDPVVPWSTSEEEKKVFEQVAKMKDQVLAINTIGYGWYYNQDFLNRIATESMFGSAIHSNKINEYLDIFSHNFEKISDLLMESVDIDVPQGVEIVYLNTNSTKFSKDGKIKLTRLEKRKNQFFLLGDGDFEFEFNGEKFNTKDIQDETQEATLTNFYYSYAYELFANGKRKDALKVLSGQIYDKYLIDKLLNVFTYDEVEAVKKEFKKAVIKPNVRFQAGKAPVGYLPREDQFCIMDALFALTEGNNEYVVSKNYNRVGIQTVDEFNLFEKVEGETRAPLNSLVYNKEQLNVSIGFKINGMVKLNARDAKEHNLPKTVDSHIFRNHTIIKDGNLNMEEITVIVDDVTFKLLHNKELEFKVNFITSVGQEADGRQRLILAFNRLPVINASYANEGNNIEDVYGAVEKMTVLEIKQKVLNHYVKEIKTNNVTALVEKKFINYTPEQIAVLKRHGISNDFTYNGVDNVKQAPVDFYEARSITFTFKGMSTIPKVEEALEKAKDPVKLAKANVQTKIMLDYIEGLKRSLAQMNLGLEDNSTETKEFLQGELEKVKNELKKERTKVHILKMAKVLTGDGGFEGVETNDAGEQIFTKNDKVLIIKQKKVKIDI